MSLTKQEKELVSKLGECMSGFYSLTSSPERHPDDVDEFKHHIHILQRHVMCREARRNNSEFFHYE